MARCPILLETKSPILLLVLVKVIFLFWSYFIIPCIAYSLAIRLGKKEKIFCMTRSNLLHTNFYLLSLSVHTHNKALYNNLSSLKVLFTIFSAFITHRVEIWLTSSGLLLNIVLRNCGADLPQKHSLTESQDFPPPKKKIKNKDFVIYL